MLKDKVSYNTIDLFKLFAAVLIVFLHTYNGDLGVYGDWVNKVLSKACVPFFFLCSGFFLKKGMEQSLLSGGTEKEDLWFKKYIWRLVRMYLAWSVLTIPVAIMIVKRGHPEYGLGMRLLYHFRFFFFTGSIGIYWYLLALIICAVVIRWCSKRNLLHALLPFSFLLFLWGCAYDSPLNRDQLIFRFLHILFGSERNFLNVGLFYVLLGFFGDSVCLSRQRNCHKVTIVLLFVISVFLRTWEVSALGTNYTQALVAISTFLLAKTSGSASAKPFYIASRHLSTGLYLIHFPIILLFDYYLRKGTLIDFPITLLISLLVYCLLANLLPLKLSEVILGHQKYR